MSKKLISILLAVLLAVPLCLAVSSDGGEIREPVFAFGGYSGAKLYGYEENASGSGWTYDAVSHIMTLDGYRAIDDGALCLYNLPCDFTVYVTPGTVNILSITETDWQSAYQDGYVPKGSLRIAGSGELDCDYLECGCRLTVCGTTVVIAEDLYAGYGFSASGADITAGFADIWEGSGPVSMAKCEPMPSA